MDAGYAKVHLGDKGSSEAIPRKGCQEINKVVIIWVWTKRRRRA